MNSKPDPSKDALQTPIAIIGMGCIFPTARNLTEFWRTLRTGRDGITEVPPSHWNKSDYFDPDPKAPDMTYCARGGFLSAVPFDPTEFGPPPFWRRPTPRNCWDWLRRRLHWRMADMASIGTSIATA
ncbi:MAG: hypothetical protein IPK83_01935 [Planctomycetes bacterium]|nr:hypothetical protein [Planctomycetota bacterium]